MVLSKLKSQRTRALLSSRTIKIRGFFIVVLCAIFFAGRAETHLTVVSQNTLHLGWGDAVYNDNKKDKLNSIFSQVSVILLQEVMENSRYDVSPGTYHWLISEKKGCSSYKEHYGFLVNDATAVVLGPGITEYESIYPIGAKRFIRPPSGILVQEKGSAAQTCYVNFHAIWGKGVSLRRAEAEAMRDAASFFMASYNTDRIIIGGDWNLKATHPGFGALLGAGFTIEPNDKSSLKRNGDPSQPYDHFVWKGPASGFSVTGPKVIPSTDYSGLSGQNYRNQVSDHLGIEANVE